MSFEAIQWALNQPLKPLHSRLLIELCSHLNATTKQCNPSISRLEKRLLCSRPSITAGLAELERLGAITKSKAINQSTTYIIHTETQLSNFTSKEFLLVKNLYSGSKKSLPPLVKNLYSGSKKSLLKTVSETVSKTVKETGRVKPSPIGSALSKIDQSKDDEIPNPKCGIFDQAGEEQIFDAFGEAPYFDKPPYRPTDDSPEAVAHRVLGYLNEQKARHLLGQHRDCESNYKEIKARIKTEKADEYTLKRIIDVKIKDWARDVKMKQYLTPSTLFCKKHFVKYCEQVEADEIRMASYWERQAEGKGIFDL